LHVYKEPIDVMAGAVSQHSEIGYRAWIWSCGICGGQNGTGAGFLLVPRFPLPIFIPPVAPQSPSSVICSWYNGPVFAAVPSGLSLTPLIIIITTIIIIIIIIINTQCIF
jgi:hypothetical protein